MALFNKKGLADKATNLTIKDPRQIISDAMKATSGYGLSRSLKFNIFYKIIAFKGVVDGVGTSTIVANTALALANIGLSVCVIDTSMLNPTQDYLLKTSSITAEKNGKDWFDMPFVKDSVLNISKRSGKISVLSFHGTGRGIIDALSTSDNEELVELAYTDLIDKFDIILVDCCHEMTTVNTVCLQRAHKVIQVWNDTPTVIANIDNFLNNCATLSCPLDKMRFVVCSKVHRGTMGNLDNVLKDYRLKKLGTTYNSDEVYKFIVMDSKLWQAASTDEDVIAFTECILDIIIHICALDTKLSTGSITSNDIMDGKVEGTMHYKYAQDEANTPEVYSPDHLDNNAFNQQYSQQEAYHQQQEAYPQQQEVYPQQQEVYPQQQEVYPQQQEAYKSQDDINYANAYNQYQDMQQQQTIRNEQQYSEAYNNYTNIQQQQEVVPDYTSGGFIDEGSETTKEVTKVTPKPIRTPKKFTSRGGK